VPTAGAAGLANEDVGGGDVEALAGEGEWSVESRTIFAHNKSSGPSPNGFDRGDSGGAATVVACVLPMGLMCVPNKVSTARTSTIRVSTGRVSTGRVSTGLDGSSLKATLQL
jgi:hypothetical protein